MFKYLIKVRYIFVVAVLFTILNSIGIMIGGIIQCWHGYMILLNHGIGGEPRPGIYLLEGLDLFLVSLVFMIFALGILRLFTHYHQKESNLPSWLKIDSFKELKILLWETVLVTLVIFTLTRIASANEELTPNALILPGIVLILSVGLFLMRKEENKK